MKDDLKVAEKGMMRHVVKIDNKQYKIESDFVFRKITKYDWQNDITEPIGYPLV